MRFVTAAVAALAVSAIAPSAMAANVASFTAENVKTMVTEAGGSNVTSQTAQGITFVNFDLNGLPFTYSLQLCDPKGKTGCAGILMAIGVALDRPLRQFGASRPRLLPVRPGCVARAARCGGVVQGAADRERRR